MSRALARIRDVRGRAFNLGGGPANAVSLLQLTDEIRRATGRRTELRFEDWRQGDQRWYVSNTGAATAALELPAPRPWRDGVAALADWLERERVPQTHMQPRLASAAQ